MIEFRPLKAEEVECRVGQCSEKGVSLLLYKDARCDMTLLDEVVGPENWDCSYESIDGKLFCTVGIRCSPEGSYHDWVYKQDTGTPSNMEAQKGEASDAFKRACFKWGIGRELYTAPFIWVHADKCNIKPGRNGKPQCYDDFRVTELEVDSGQIVKLTICNMSRKGVVVYGNAPKNDEQPTNDVLKIAYQRMGEAIEDWCRRHGCDSPEQIQAKKDGVKKRPEWPSQCKSLEYINAIAREFQDG